MAEFEVLSKSETRPARAYFKSPPKRQESQERPTAGAAKFSFADRGIQPKLKVGQPNDIYEQEADRVADAVIQSAPNPAIQRLCTLCAAGGTPCPECREEEEMVIQRTANEMGEEWVPESFFQSLGPGKPLDPSTRTFMESRFGHDFTQVLVHTGDRATESARGVNALAYAIGSDIVFGAGQYSVNTPAGRRLLAHELTHVVQQLGTSLTPRSRPALIQRTIGDGHDLASPRFAGDPDLEAAYDNERLITEGDTGPAVLKIQHALVDAGFHLPAHSVDGMFGPETKAAVEAFQAAHGLVVDGRVGPSTMGAIDALFPALASRMLPAGPWTMACVLSILCPWNRSVVDQLRGTTVTVADRIYWEDPYYDGSSWTTRTFEGGGSSSATARQIGLLSGASCTSAADTLYHEIWHQNQPMSFRTEESEIGAYRFTEQWLVYHGLPGRPSFRRTDPVTGATIIDVSAVTSFVRAQYPGPTATAGEQVIGRTPSGDSRVMRADGTVYTRPPVAGDSYPGPMQVVGSRTISSGSWVCPPVTP